MIKRIRFVFLSFLLVVLFVSLIHHTASAASSQTDITSTTTFTIRGGNGNDAYDANGNAILKPHQVRGANIITLDASLNGRTAELPVGTLLFLHFSTRGQVSVNPSKGVVEGAKGKHHLPNGDIAILQVVGQGTATITVITKGSSKGTKNAAGTSGNWSGYARTTGGTFNDITSNWTVPTASSCSSGDTYSSAWIGIDGATNSDLIQTGTESDCVSGSSFYQAWWEILPAVEQPITGTVNPGDKMFAEIKQGASNWIITIKDLTQNWTYSTNQSYSGSQSSAEWILEAPTINGSTATLTNYGLETFTDDTQNGVNPQHSYSTDSIDMVDAGNNNISTTSNPNSLTDAFSVQYGSTQPSSPASWSTNSPSGSTYDNIYAMSAPTATSAWAVGYEQPSGASKQPVTYYNNGSSWTKYSPPSQGIYTNHWLYGIAANSSADAWTVGEYVPSNHQTLAYRWNNSTHAWSLITSDNPASSGYSNELYGVAIDSSGNVYAVGQYWITGSGYQPLLEKWNGTKLAQQSLSLPSGETGATLNSIAFSSSSNGWAVGTATGTTNSYIIYHYDGSSWTPTLGSITNANLKSVVIVSSSEAWAVGSQGSSNTPLILHYTSANGWAEDTSFNSNYPSNAALYSVGADNSSNVWIVGSSGYYNNYAAFTMHYNGSSWTQVSTPSVSISTFLQGVAVNSGKGWAGGLSHAYTSQPTPLVYTTL